MRTPPSSLLPRAELGSCSPFRRVGAISGCLIDAHIVADATGSLILSAVHNENRHYQPATRLPVLVGSPSDEQGDT